jgi:hypothetical protein
VRPKTDSKSEIAAYLRAVLWLAKKRMEWVYMTDIKHIDIDSDEFEDAPKALRDYARKLKAANESLAKERDGALQKVASRAIADVLADKGFKNPKRVERDLLAEGIDVSDKDSIEGWLAENGDDYAKGEVVPVETPEASAEQQALAAGHQQLQAAGAQIRDTSGMTPLQRAQSELPANATAEDVLAAYAKHGV